MKIHFFTMLLRTLFVLLVIMSISVMYYIFVVKKEYTVFTNPDGPEMSVDGEDIEI